MKAFRNWWEKSKYFFNNAVNGYWVEKGWRAALEEVLKVTEMYEESWDHSVSDWIKKELNGDE